MIQYIDLDEGEMKDPQTEILPPSSIIGRPDMSTQVASTRTHMGSII